MTAQVLPQGKQYFVKADGTPGVGWKLYTTDTGTNNPRTTWQDAAQTTPNANPVVMDARGEAIIFWSGTYRVRLEDNLGNTIWPAIDGISYIDPTTTLLADLALFNNGAKGAGMIGFGPSIAYSANTVGSFLNQIYARTAAEIAAAAVVTLYYYPPGDIRRYGALTSASAATNKTAITAAIGQSAQAGGVAAYVPTGEFTTNALVVIAGMSIYGDGMDQSIIKLAAAVNDHLLSIANADVYTDNVSIKDIAFDGNKANNTSGVGVYLNGRYNNLKNVFIKNCVLAGLLVGAPNNGATNTPLAGHHTFTDLYAYNNGKSNTWGNIGITHGSHMTWNNIHAWSDDGQAAYAFDIEADPGDAIDDINVSNFTFAQGRAFIDGANLGGALFVTRVNFSNGSIDGTGSYSPADSSNMAAIWMRQCKGVKISNVDIIGHATRTFVGISVEDAGTTTTFAAEDIAISNVRLVTVSPACRTGYFSKVKNLKINGLYLSISSTSNGMEFPNSTDVRVGGGSEIVNAGAGAAVSIGATSINVQFDETCQFTGTVTVNATALAAGCEVRRILKGSVAFDPPNLADGAGTTTTVTVNGAALGDFVDDVSFGLDLQGITLTAYVSIANTVAVRFQNESGGALDLASGTLSARVLKVA